MIQTGQKNVNNFKKQKILPLKQKYNKASKKLITHKFGITFVLTPPHVRNFTVKIIVITHSTPAVIRFD